MSTPNPTPSLGVAATRPGTRAQAERRRDAPVVKAARLIAEDRVMLAPDAQVYRVLGDTDTYNVVASPEGIWCPCPARNPLCAHVLATAMIRQRGKAAPERLMKDLGVAS